ncbi:MAG: TetR/AcrR family transcriptional regulator [Pseudomonadales bacterium]
MNATLECIVKFGYENTTMAKIAGVAEVSQGSMQYHFGSKIEAIKAAINHLHEVRLAQHRRALEEVPLGADPMAHVIELYWKQLNEAHFIAYQDLVIAARTHPELASVMKPAYQRFVQAWRYNAVEVIPEWAKVQDFELIADIGQYILEGLAYGQLNGQLSKPRTQQVLQFAKKLLIDMVEENIRSK